MNQLKYAYLTSLLAFMACTPLKAETVRKHQIAPKVAHGKTYKAQRAITKTSSNSSLSSFELSGAIAAKNNKRRKGWSASINWTQQGPNHYQIRLIAPMGGQAMIIERHGAAITYREGAKKVTSNNGSDLLQKQTGIHLPVNNLYYWVRGIPAPGSIQAATYDNNHYLLTLQQGGYNIVYSQYMASGQTFLPSKIHLQGPNVMIKLSIKRWNH